MSDDSYSYDELDNAQLAEWWWAQFAGFVAYYDSTEQPVTSRSAFCASIHVQTCGYQQNVFG